MKVFDNYEISPCRRYEEPDSPGKCYFEVCEPHEADVWTLYGHVNGEGVQAIGDFTNRESAEEIFCRITGLNFIGSYTADAHLRIMHMGQELLTALKHLAEQADKDCPAGYRTRHFTDALEQAHAVISAATAESACHESDEPDMHAVLAARRQVAVVWNIEDVQEIRPKLTDEQAWAVLQAADRYHDANIGINWDVLRCHADMLFGDAPQTDNAAEA